MQAFLSHLRFDSWKLYWRILAQSRRNGVRTALCFALAALLESCALVILWPLLNSLSGSVQGKDGAAGWLPALLEAGQSPEHQLQISLVMFTVTGVTAAVIKICAERMLLKIRNDVEISARKQMVASLLEMEWSQFVRQRHGEISKAIMAEGSNIAYGVRLFLFGLSSLFAALVFVAFAALVSPLMTLYTLVFGGAAGLVYIAASTPLRRNVEELNTHLTGIGIKVNDIFGNLKFYRATGRTTAARDDAGKIFSEYADAYFRTQRYSPTMRGLLDLAAVIFIGVFLYWQIVISGESIATIIIFLAIFYRLAPKIATMQDCFFQARSYLPWYERWKKRIDLARAHRQQPGGTAVPTFANGLAFDLVSFAFDPQQPVLQDISLQVRAGDCIAIVGPSGGGKSTLLDLVTGLLTPTGGRLLLGGQPLETFDREAWCAHLGYVPQECPLFHTSVLANIAWGDPQPDLARALDCARRAHALEFIEALPEGMDTVIGERGARLSGGQRQRLGIARALYRDAWLLILDEATSALDGASEEIVQHALEEMKGSVAMLVVAHRLKTVRMADRIIVMDGGRIAEEGTWDELVQRRGKFSDMLAQQGMVQ